MLRKKFTDFLGEQWLQAYDNYTPTDCLMRLSEVETITDKLIVSWAEITAVYNKKCKTDLVKNLKGDRNTHYRKGKRLVIDQLITDYISPASVLVKSKDCVYKVKGVNLAAEKTRIKLSEIIARDLLFIISRFPESLKGIHLYLMHYNERSSLAIVDIERIHEYIFNIVEDEADLWALNNRYGFHEGDILAIADWKYRGESDYLMAFMRYSIGVPALRDWATYVEFENQAYELKPIFRNFSTESITQLKLGIANEEICKDFAFAEAENLTELIEKKLDREDKSVAVGGYMEIRPFYSMPAYREENERRWRTMHMGVDVWCPAGTPVYSPLRCVVHSVKDNALYGDYGPTVILKVIDLKFHLYLLYGHLSRKSLDRLEVGAVIEAGDLLGEIGDMDENGAWPPHLHFQLIRSMFHHVDNFYGLCNPEYETFWREICPSPFEILQINMASTQEEENSDDIVVEMRDGSILIDALGQRFLDLREEGQKYGHNRLPMSLEYVKDLHEAINGALRNESFSFFRLSILSDLKWKLEVEYSSPCIDMSSSRLYSNITHLFYEEHILVSEEEGYIVIHFPHCIIEEEINSIIRVFYKIEDMCS